MIQFIGVNRIRVKTFSAKDLKIEEYGEDYLVYEVRKKYFSIFWIPFYYLGNEYILRKNGQVADISDEHEMLLHTKEYYKTPWYLYSGIWLISTILIAIYIDSFYKERQILKANEQFIQQKLNYIDSPTVFDYYTVFTYQHNLAYEMKVDSFTIDSIRLKIPLSEDKSLYITAYDIDQYLSDTNTHCKTVWVAKSDLKRAIENDPENLSNFKGALIPAVLGYEKFNIDKIERIKQYRIE